MPLFINLKKLTKNISLTKLPMLSAGISALRYILFSPFAKLPNHPISSFTQISHALLLSSVEGGLSYLGTTVSNNVFKKIINDSGNNTLLPTTVKDSSITSAPYKERLKLYLALLYALSCFIYKNQADAMALEYLGFEQNLTFYISYLTPLVTLYSDFGIGYLGSESFIIYLNKFGYNFSESESGVKIKKEVTMDDEEEQVELIFKQKIN